MYRAEALKKTEAPKSLRVLLQFADESTYLIKAGNGPT
jgi:hypothetical protein